MRIPVELAAVAALCLTGCGKPAPVGAVGATNAPPEKSTSKQAIEGFTGKTVIDAGTRTKAKIQAIYGERNKDLKEVIE